MQRLAEHGYKELAVTLALMAMVIVTVPQVPVLASVDRISLATHMTHIHSAALVTAEGAVRAILLPALDHLDPDSARPLRVGHATDLTALAGVDDANQAEAGLE
jgi:hypothetical protein